MAKCSIELYSPQSFVMPVDDTAGYIQTDESVCLDVNSSHEHAPVLLIACNELQRQKWRVERNNKQIIHNKTGLCLSLDKRGTYLSIRKCKNNFRKQQWLVLDRKWRF